MTAPTPLTARSQQFSTADPISVSGIPSDQLPSPEQAEYERRQKTLELALERFRDAANAENKQREEMLHDLRFRCGMQWDEAMELQRKNQGRPCLVVNRIPGFVKHVTNQMRQQRPEIKVDPVGSGADEVLAELRQGLIRHIQVRSRAENAYDTAFEHLCVMGLGYIRVIDAWVDDDSFDKELRIEWVANPFTVYNDPNATKRDWSDARYRFVVEDITREEYIRRFGQRDEFDRPRAAVSLSNFQSIGDHQSYWYPGGKIRIAEYLHVEDQPDELQELSDGRTVYASAITPEEQAEMEAASVVPLRTREVVRQKVIWSLMDGLDIIKEREWKGKYIPIIPVIGNMVELDGDRIIHGMVRYAREQQRAFNYFYSCLVEAVALSPKNQFVAEIDQISETRDAWQRANTDPQAVLTYKAKSLDGNLLPPPHREQAEPPIQALVQALHLADQNLKSVFSIYEASLGQKGPQESGVAINSRKLESDLATYDWQDNFIQALQFLGIVLDDLIPHYYNTPGRVIQIVREDLTQQAVEVLKPIHGDDGEETVWDLAQGRFGITISTGPSFQTRRQESAKSMLDMLKIYPGLMQIAGPTIVKAMDWPEKEAISAAMERAMPQELRTPDPNAPQQSPELQQAQALIQKLSQAVEELSDDRMSKRIEMQADLFKESLKQETALAIADMKVQAQNAQFLNDKLFEQLNRIQSMLEPQVLAGDAKESPAQPGQEQQPQPAAPAQQVPQQALPQGETPVAG